MPHASFSILDDNPDGRYMLSRTILRRFPRSVVNESQDLDAALEAMKNCPPSAVLVHRTLEADQIQAIQRIRAEQPNIPIVALSGDEKRESDALKAGATKFLHYDRWLIIGTVLADLMPPRNDNHG